MQPANEREDCYRRPNVVDILLMSVLPTELGLGQCITNLRTDRRSFARPRAG